MKKILISLVLCISCATTAVGQNNPSDNGEGKKSGSPIEKVVDWYMDNMNYGTLTLLMTVESSFIPFPSEVVVPPAAYKARQPDSGMNLPLIVFFATLGALFGALFNYYLALWLGRPIIHKFAESRIGKMCLLSSEKVDRAEKYFDEHGKISTFIGRLVPVIRQLISLPAGLARMNIWIFMLYTTIGALIWNTVLTAIGAIAGDNKAHFEKYYTELSWVCVVAGILFIIYLVYNGFKKKR